MESKIKQHTIIMSKFGAMKLSIKMNILLGVFIIIFMSFWDIFFNFNNSNLSIIIILLSFFFIQINIILWIFLAPFQRIISTANSGGGISENTEPEPEREAEMEPEPTPSISYRMIVLKHDETLSVIDVKLMGVLESLEKYEYEENEVLSIKNSIYEYARNKAQFLKIKDNFLILVARDTQNIGVSLEELIELTDTITSFRKSLESLADHILQLTPIDPFQIFDFPEPGIFREMLFEENSWIEGEALSMLAILKEWLVVHTEEIKGEKEKLMDLLKNEDTFIGDVLKITKSIHEQTIEKIQVQL